MPVIPTITAQPGDVPQITGTPRADTAALMAPAIALSRSGQQLADTGQRFALEYANFKVETQASEQTAALSRQLNEAEFEASKIPDRMKATADYDQRVQKIRDDWNANSDVNIFVRSKVQGHFNAENEARRASAQKAAFRLESETARGKAAENINNWSVQAADPMLDPRLRDQLIKNNESTIDGLVKAGQMSPETGASAKLKMKSNVYSSMIEMGRARDPRFGITLYENYKQHLTLEDRTRLEPEIEGAKIDIKAQDTVTQGMPQMGAFGNVSHWVQHIATASQQTGVRQSLIAGIASAESAGVATAVSPVTGPAHPGGYTGPMQLGTGAAAEVGVTDRNKPEQAIPGGAAYFKKQLDRFGGSEVAALAAYNWGPENVEKWLKNGASWSTLPKETQNYIEKVMAKDREFAKAAGGDTYEAWKARSQRWMIDLANNTSMDPRVRNAALAKASNMIALTGGAIEAERKQIADDAEVTGLGIFNKTYKPGDFGKIAERYRKSGDLSRASMFDFMAANEGAFQDFAQQPLENQRLMAAYLPGIAGKHAMQIVADTRENRKDARQEASRREAQLWRDVDNDVDPRTLVGAMVAAAQAWNAGGENDKAQDLYKRFVGRVQGKIASQLPPMEAEEAHRQMKEAAEGGMDPIASAALAQFNKSRQKFIELAKNDPLNAYSHLTGPIVQFNPQMGGVELQQWAIERTRQQRLVQGFVQPNAAEPTVPFLTQAEIDNWKTVLDHGNVQRRQVSLATVSAAIPPEQLKLVARQFAGKDPMGDIYAEAMALYQSGTPGARTLADSIIKGGNELLEGGTEGKNRVQVPTTMAMEIDALVGPARKDMMAQDKRRQDHAIMARYVDLRGAKIGQDTGTDSGDLRRAVRDVVGTQMIGRMGGAWLIPSNIEPYQFRDAIGTMTAADIPPLRDAPGAVQADPKKDIAALIKREGVYQSIAEGQYYVWLPDPLRGSLGQVIRADTGKPWVLDVRPLLNRPVTGSTRGDTGADRITPAMRVQQPVLPPSTGTPPAAAPPPSPSGADLIRQQQRNLLNPNIIPPQ